MNRLQAGGVTLVLAALAGTAFGQGGAPATPGGGRQNRGGQGQNGGRQRMGQSRSQSDPKQNHALDLLMRPDVQKEIQLDLKQKNQIEALRQGAQTDFQAQMQQNRNNFQRPDFNASQEDRQAQMEQFRQQMQQRMAQMQQQMADFTQKTSEKVFAVLKPEQVARLKQLDLQWRGPMAMADSKVANAVKLGDQSKTGVEGTYTAWQQKRMSAFQNFGGFGRRGGGGQPGDPNAGNPQVDWQARMAEINKQQEADRKASEEEVLNGIDKEELARWNAAKGKEFTFHEDPNQGPAESFLGGFGGFGGPGGGRGNRGGGPGGGGRGNRGGGGQPGGGGPQPNGGGGGGN